MYFKWTERQPFALLSALSSFLFPLSPYLYLYALAFRCIEHGVPFRFGYLNLYTLTISLLPAIRSADTSHACFVLAGRKHEVERRNIARHGDIAIIRKDGRQALGLFG